MAEGSLPQYYRLTKCLPSGTAVSQAGCVRSIQKTKRNQANDPDDLYQKVHSHQISHVPTSFCISSSSLPLEQGCISCGILVSGIGARGVSSEHMENMEMFSCSPT